ncbi:hypothetical protein OUZ56_001142 [Daphnia magna]|uniref:Uncharacterized protein n=1 Tax=Daphnia magna TaxID=35525 RepID=A0ABR0A1S4_9CRUS|nr:hypothetical protein OUZ56_001142 [Daphnia magna]
MSDEKGMAQTRKGLETKKYDTKRLKTCGKEITGWSCLKETCTREKGNEWKPGQPSKSRCLVQDTHTDGGEVLVVLLAGGVFPFSCRWMTRFGGQSNANSRASGFCALAASFCVCVCCVCVYVFFFNHRFVWSSE